MDKRIAEFTDERFYGHIKFLIDAGMQNRNVEMLETLYFLTDLQNFIQEMKEEMKENGLYR